MRLGILGCSDIAYKRFMPAVSTIRDIEVVAVAEEYDKSKIYPFCQKYNLEGMDGFDDLIARSDIDAVYVPQPPALHFKWAKIALLHDKHVFLEKPSTISLELSSELVRIASERKLALHENYMFQYHSQMNYIRRMLNDGMIGDVRMYRTSFGFPMRSNNDFRYFKELGGGALLDAGGYTVKLASILLGKSIKVDFARLNYMDGFEVDMLGSGQLSNDEGKVCQIGFGMDCAYRCNLEVWGSRGYLSTNRIFTAPDGFQPTVKIEIDGEIKDIKIEADNHFKHSIETFVMETHSEEHRRNMYTEIIEQAYLVERIKTMSEI